MKQFTQVICALLMLIVPSLVFAQQIDLPVTFDNANLTYTMVDFGGNASSVVTDPSAGGGNNQVAKVIKGTGAELWAGTTIGGTTGFATAIPFSQGSTKISVRVFSPDSGIVVKLKVEVSTDNTKCVETDTRTTKANAWETLEFDFANQSANTAAINFANSYNKLSIFFNFGTTGAVAGEKTYYCDDIQFVAGALSQINLPVSFDNNTVDYNMIDFGGNASSVATDPTNQGNKVAKVIKGTGAETWAGTTVGTTAGFASAIPFVNGSTKMSVNIFSPDSGIVVKVKVEDPNDNTKSVETDTRTTKANAWETLEFDFAKQSNGTATINFATTYKKLSVFFNFGVTGATAGEKTYYFDDIRFVTPVIEQIALPVTFDKLNTDYTLIDFGGNASSVIADPNNQSNKVAKVIKGAGAEVWAGTTVGTPAGFASAIPFVSGSTKMSVNIFSPDSGIVVKVKVEDPNDNTKSVETDTKTTKANAWETLEFDFANQSNGTAAINFANTYKKLSVFFNFGVTGATAGEKTYYFDDIRFVTPVIEQIALPVTFDKSNTDYTLIDFGGNASSVIADPNDANNKVAKVIKTGGSELWAGTTVGTQAGFASAIPFASNATKMTMRVYSPDAGISVRMKAEDPNDATKSVETEAKTTKTNEWETLEFDFTNHANGTAPINYSYTYKKLSVFFNFGVTGAIAGEKTYYFDDIAFGGSGNEPTKTFVTFRVDMAKNKPADTDTITLNGSFNGWCGMCTPMTKVPNTDIWTATLLLDMNATYDYKYVVGNWVKQEILKEGSSCTTTKSGYTNRNLVVNKTNDTLPLVCWESCTDCANTLPKTKVTFKVNMKNYVGDMSKGVTLNGSFNGWCGECNKMDSIGNNIYATTLNLDSGSYDFKFTIGNWEDQESFSTSDPCTKTVGNYTNRFMDVTGAAEMTVGTYCWNTCTMCDVTGLIAYEKEAMKVYPNPASEVLYIQFEQGFGKNTKIAVYNSIGQVMLVDQNSNKADFETMYPLQIKSLNKGMYFLKVETNSQVKTIPFVVE